MLPSPWYFKGLKAERKAFLLTGATYTIQQNLPEGGEILDNKFELT